MVLDGTERLEDVMASSRLTHALRAYTRIPVTPTSCAGLDCHNNQIGKVSLHGCGDAVPHATGLISQQ